MGKLGKVKKVIEVDYNDFEDLVNETYGEGYDFVADIEGKNYSSYDYSVSKEDLEDLDDEVEAKVRSGKYPQYCTSDVIIMLYKDGLIEKGQYLIKVFW